MTNNKCSNDNMRRATHIILMTLAMLFLAGQQPLNAKDDYDIYELSLDENLLLPEIKKYSPMKKLALVEKKCQIQGMNSAELLGV